MIYVLTVMGLLLMAGIAVFLFKEMAATRTAMHQQMAEISRQMNEHLRENTRVLESSHKGYREAVGQVQHRLGELHEATHSMVEIGKDISSLQDILRAPKLRGGLGELFLGELLGQILPQEHYSLQYSFDTGSMVDAVIFLGEGKIPVDAKFPLENFRRLLGAGDEEQRRAAKKAFTFDVKRHVDAIASKYILPAEGTFDFALMYIPAENVYYETIIKDDCAADSIAAYAIEKRVIPVSPNSFYAYLQAIVRGLKGLKIESSAKAILQNLSQIETDFGKFLTEFEKVGGHLQHAQSAYNKAEKSFDKLQTKLTSIETQPADPQLTSETVPS